MLTAMEEKRSSGKCARCGRALSDPVSVERGMGPVCAGKTRAEEQRQGDERIAPEYRGPISLNDLPKGPATKVYVGIRGAGLGETVVTVEQNGRSRLLRHVVYHSPTGMEWGYGGSGPADLARSILADVAGLKVADALYQDFKWAVVVGLPREGFRLVEKAIRQWLAKQLQGKEGRVVMLNRIILIGRLVREPELRYTPNGIAVSRFTLAVDRPFTNQQGEREADFIRCKAWRKLAETVANNLSKGRLVAVDGRLEVTSYEDNSGNRRTNTSVVAESVRFLDWPKDRNQGGGQEEGQAEGYEGYDDDLPF